TRSSTADNYYTRYDWGGPTGITLPSFPNANDLRHAVAVGDFNGDGRLDLITSNGSSGWIVCPSTGSSFSPCGAVAGLGSFTGIKSSDVLFGDFNGDGRTDIAMITGTSAWQICLANNAAPSVSFTCQAIT